MKLFLKRVMCWLGLHKYTYFGRFVDVPLKRYCIRCSKKQKGFYDMCYGEEYWKDF